jgi:hypothetical protein
MFDHLDFFFKKKLSSQKEKFSDSFNKLIKEKNDNSVRLMESKYYNIRVLSKIRNVKKKTNKS